MEQISDELYQALKQEYANPFSKRFDISELKKSLKDHPTKQEENILAFIEYCDYAFKGLKSNIFEVFQKLNISPNELKSLFFSAVNKYFLDTHPLLIAQMKEGGTAVEIERSAFYKYTNELGQSVDAQFIVELGGDVLNKLMQFSHEWEETITIRDFRKVSEIDTEELGKLFHIVWINTNIIINLEGSAFDIVAFENGSVHFKENDSQIKIETGLNGVHLLKKAGLLRSTNNLNEWYMPLLKVYEKERSYRKGVKSIKFQRSELEIECGKVNEFATIAKAEAEIFVFHPHFINEKLKEFDGFTLFDLIEILVLIEEIIQRITHENIVSYQELVLGEIPIKIREDHLIDFLIDCTKKPKEFILKAIETLIAPSTDYYFWRVPLVKDGDFFFFCIPVLLAPNHSLFIDKWTKIAGYSAVQKNILFKSFISKELFETERTTFQFDHKTSEDLQLSSDKFANNIIIETSEWLLLLETIVYDFPIESKEIDEVIKQLGNGTANLTDKWKIISEKGIHKPIIPLVLTNYNVLSGMVINQIGVIDLTLFKNYFFVGKYRKAVVSYDTGTPEATDSVTFPYYHNEVDFNKNLVNFLRNPPPIELITQRFCWEEISITPDFIKPAVLVDKIDHITESELIDKQIDGLTHAVNYEYFADPTEKDRSIIDASITFSLGSIFHQLAHAPYESLSKRIDAYHTLRKTKQIGFAHLVYYINESLPKFNGKQIVEKKTFDTVFYDPDTVYELLKNKGGKLSGQIRLSEFEFGNEFSTEEEKQIISLALDLLSILGARKYTDEELEGFYFPLILLKGLNHKYELSREFYAICGNFIDTLNFNHKFQRARDFCEEILVLSINRKEPFYGWGFLFKCFTTQNNQFESAIHGCIYFSSALGFSELPYDLALDVLYNSLKFFRNFRFNTLTKNVYESLKYFPLEEYDEQKVSLSYFNSLLQGPIDENPELLNEAIDYLEEKQDAIIDFGNHGITPWLAYLYNIKRLCDLKHIEYTRDFSHLLKKLEVNSDPNVLKNIRSMVLGDGLDTKTNFIQSLLNIRETRASSDYIYEIRQLQVAANNLITNSFNPIDYDGLFLAGFVLNDQTLVFDNVYLEPGTIAPSDKPKDEDFERIVNAYSDYLTKNIPLKEGQLFVWLFNHHTKVYALTISSSKELDLVMLNNWNIKSMDEWIGNLQSFYFNCEKKSYYDVGEQESDHEKLLREIGFALLNVNQEFDELLVTSSLDLSGFPANLLIQESNFIACSKPVSNVISVEWMTKFGHKIKIKHNWSSSAWLPIEDGDGTVNWGYDKISLILNDLGATIHISHYPKSEINTDVNIFLAHGALETSGFKAIYTNDEGESAILYPKAVFGSGTIAILFICNSGSAKDDFYSNSVTSFSIELLKDDYNTVIAPFWPFDVAISPIWLKEFTAVFNGGMSVSQAVYLANQKVSKYDEKSSSCYLAPQGRLAMHLYGNPNVYIENEKSS